MIKKLLYILGLLILIGTASADWSIQDSTGTYNGTVQFNNDGTGTALINNVYNINFDYNIGQDDTITATYLWYRVSLIYNSTGDYIYSPEVSGIELIRST